MALSPEAQQALIGMAGSVAGAITLAAGGTAGQASAFSGLATGAGTLVAAYNPPAAPRKDAQLAPVVQTPAANQGATGGTAGGLSWIWLPIVAGGGVVLYIVSRFLR